MRNQSYENIRTKKFIDFSFCNFFLFSHKFYRIKNDVTINNPALIPPESIEGITNYIRAFSYCCNLAFFW